MEETILKGKTLLVVDDETDLRDIVASELEFMGGTVFQAENISVAKNILAKNKIDLIVSDIRMPGGTGIDLLDSVKENNVNVPAVILITGFADITAQEAFDRGAEALMNKPFKLDDLIQVASRYISPENERFNDSSQLSTKKLVVEFAHDFAEDSNMALGRGGLALTVDTHGKKYDLGEVIDFNFKFTDLVLSGTGILRWIKLNDHQPGKVSMGIEFINLEETSLKFLLSHTSKKILKAFIPSIS